MTSSIETIAKQVECSICLQTYKNPKALPCLHTYCKVCLQCMIDKRTQDRAISCPQCRAVVPIESTNAGDLPTVFFINQLIESLEILKQAKSTEIACQNCQCEEPRVSTAYCQSCPLNGMFVCANCVSAHENMRAFAGHLLTPLSALQQGTLLHLPSASTNAQFNCSAHGLELKFYCIDCEVLVCLDCTLVDHRGHNFDFVKSVAATFKQEVQASTLTLKDGLKTVQVAKERVCDAIAECTHCMRSSAQTINSACDQLIAIVEEQRKTMLAQAKDLAAGKMDTLENQETELRQAASTVGSVLNFVDNSISNASDVEFVSMKPTVTKRISEVTEAIARLETGLKTQPNFVVALCPCVRKFQSLCQTSCTVNVDIEDSSKAFTNKVGTLSLSICNATGESSPTVPLTVEAHLTSGVDGSVTPCYITHTPPAKYQVSFTARTRGRHKVTISVNNCEVAVKQIFIHHPPSHLGKPVRILDASEPWGVSCGGAFADGGEVYAVNGSHISKYCKGRSQVQSDVGLLSDSHPRGVAIGEGFVFVTTDYKLHKLNRDCSLVKSIGTGTAGSGPCEFNTARCARVHKGNVFVCDWHNHRVQVFDSDLNFVTSFGQDADMKSPIDVDFDSQGNAYVDNVYSNRIVAFNSERRFQRQFGAKENGELLAPWGICVFEEHVFVTEHHGHCVSVFTLCGDFVYSFGQEGRQLGQLMYPHGIAVDSDGFCFVADEDNNRIQVF